MVTVTLQSAPASIAPVAVKHTVFKPSRNELPVLRLSFDGLKTRRRVLLSASSSLIMSSFQQPDQSPPCLPSENQSVAAILFGNGSDSRLCPLTRRRSAGAIPFGANFRLIDAVVSNCINSNITKIYALTQFNSTSLNSHLSRAYSDVGLGKEGFVEVIAACQSPGNHSWFQGNADAVRRFLWVLEDCPVKEFLILPGYHLYRMNYQEILWLHHQTKADITISALSLEKRQDKGFGVLKVNSQDKVVELIETRTLIPTVGRLEDYDDDNYNTFASMGIYVIGKDVMLNILKDYLPWANDFESEVIPGAISLGMKVQAYLFEGYWESMRSVKAFYKANMESIKITDIRYNLFDRVTPLYTLPQCLPATKVTDAVIMDSVVGGGCILNNCRIKGSVVGQWTRVEDGAVIEDSILMGSDNHHREDLQCSNMDKKKLIIPIGIGEGSLIRKAIIDKNARIGKRVMIINKDGIEEGSREDDGFAIRDGIVIVVRNAIIPNDTIL